MLHALANIPQYLMIVNIVLQNCKNVNKKETTMTVIESIFLGLLQGFTEFLPVSSSGHLILAQKLWDIPGNLFFDVMLHLGTLLAVVISMRKTIWQAIVNWKNKKMCCGWDNEV